jgi:hypothetical protein
MVAVSSGYYNNTFNWFVIWIEIWCAYGETWTEYLSNLYLYFEFRMVKTTSKNVFCVLMW